jgi:formate/nitrite transporter FocA (FNT family)
MPFDRTAHLIAPVIQGPVQRRSFYRSFIQFLCSNLGLVLVVVGYSVGGAFLFQLLEQYIELQNCQEGSCKFLKYSIFLIHIFSSIK